MPRFWQLQRQEWHQQSQTWMGLWKAADAALAAAALLPAQPAPAAVTALERLGRSAAACWPLSASQMACWTLQLPAQQQLLCTDGDSLECRASVWQHGSGAARLSSTCRNAVAAVQVAQHCSNNAVL